MTFYERKLNRIIKSLQEDLPNVKLYETEPSQQIVRRLVGKRDNLQYAKELCIWRVGSDGLNKISQGEEGIMNEGTQICSFDEEKATLDKTVLSFDNKQWFPPNTLQKVSTNGEICWDVNDKVFVVFDETYAYEVGRTKYPLVATAILDTYAREYLN